MGPGPFTKRGLATSMAPGICDAGHNRGVIRILVHVPVFVLVMEP